jgi:protein gp37
MGKTTGISWTDHTFNPWWGCTKVSAGCDHCYAETFDKRVGGNHWGKGAPRRVFADKHWAEPLAWDAAAAKAGKPAFVFCASMADVMDDEAPEGQRERLWELIDKTPNLIWQLLTKRPQRYARYLPHEFRHGNVWLGATAEDQANFDLRWPILLQVALEHYATHWISYEPALGPLSMMAGPEEMLPDWVIFGGESGDGRRPMERKWADDLLAECRISGTKFFMKQFSARTPDEGKKLIPAELLIHEFPKVETV